MGALDGVRVVEVAGVGPAPFAAMLLADMGAEVLRLDRAEWVRDDRRTDSPADLLNRGKRSVGIDLKSPSAAETVLRLVEGADVLIEGFRPGVAERLGIGPETCLARNPRLVYGRMTGWGQEGPWADKAGHDINYIALAGVLAHLGRAGEPPVPPINLIGDFGGGGLLMAWGVACALLERERSGSGQVIDAAMLDGSALLATHMYSMRAAGVWKRERGTNLVDTGSPFYDVYETADGKYVSLGSVEPQFYARLLEKLGLSDEPVEAQMDETQWPRLKKRIAEVIMSMTRDAWSEELAGTDLCFAPVLDYDEAHLHPHNAQRGTFVEQWGVLQPAPAPRLSRTPSSVASPPPAPGRDTEKALLTWGFEPDEVSALRASGTLI